MDIDTKDKRINVMNIICRTFNGITPTGAIDQNDKENYAWLYIPYTYPDITAITGEMYERSIDCSVGCKL